MLSFGLQSTILQQETRETAMLFFCALKMSIFRTFHGSYWQITSGFCAELAKQKTDPSVSCTDHTTAKI